MVLHISWLPRVQSAFNSGELSLQKGAPQLQALSSAMASPAPSGLLPSSLCCAAHGPQAWSQGWAAHPHHPQPTCTASPGQAQACTWAQACGRGASASKHAAVRMEVEMGDSGFSDLFHEGQSCLLFSSCVPARAGCYCARENKHVERECCVMVTGESREPDPKSSLLRPSCPCIGGLSSWDCLPVPQFAW